VGEIGDKKPAGYPKDKIKIKYMNILSFQFGLSNREVYFSFASLLALTIVKTI